MNSKSNESVNSVNNKAATSSNNQAATSSNSQAATSSNNQAATSSNRLEAKPQKHKSGENDQRFLPERSHCITPVPKTIPINDADNQATTNSKRFEAKPQKHKFRKNNQRFLPERSHCITSVPKTIPINDADNQATTNSKRFEAKPQKHKFRENNQRFLPERSHCITPVSKTIPINDVDNQAATSSNRLEARSWKRNFRKNEQRFLPERSHCITPVSKTIPINDADNPAATSSEHLEARSWERNFRENEQCFLPERFHYIPPGPKTILINGAYNQAAVSSNRVEAKPWERKFRNDDQRFPSERSRFRVQSQRFLKIIPIAGAKKQADTSSNCFQPKLWDRKFRENDQRLEPGRSRCIIPLPRDTINCADNQAATHSNYFEPRPWERNFQEHDQCFHPERSICITPLPKTTSFVDLLLFLNRFGEIKTERHQQNILWVEYQDSAAVNILLNQPIWLQKEQLCVRRFRRHIENSGFHERKRAINIQNHNLKNEHVQNNKRNDMQDHNEPNHDTHNHDTPNNNISNKTKEEEISINYDRIKDFVEAEVTFDSQLAALLNKIRLTDFELITRYNVICTHLNEIFRTIFPDCQTYKFGSTVAGLSFKESDLDIYMYVGEIALPSSSHHRPDASPNMLMLTIFRKVRRIMYGMKSVFSNIVPIPKAKTPIIKFRYIPTNVSCDISFKNSLGIYKSNFLRYCASRDPRIQSLMLLIKYWARHFGISGNGRISSYGLVCLIIFYLQQEQVGLLPSLLQLQETCDPLILYEWQVNFNENTVLPPISNSSSVAELFHNFFSFYVKFRFDRYVICLLDGKTYIKQDFKPDKLPDYMDRYKTCVIENSVNKFDVCKPLCIQDPIELNQNTAATTSDYAVATFQLCCKFSDEIYATAKVNNYENTLKTLFNRPYQLLSKKKRKTKFRNMIEAGCYIDAGYPGEDSNVRIDISNKVQYKKDNWYFMIFNLIRDIFEMIFKLQVEIIIDQEAKQQKIDLLSDVHTRTQKKIAFRCTGNKCVWYNRKKNNRNLLDVQLSLLEKEAILSDKVLEQLNDDTNNIQLDFICTLEKADNPVAVIITLNDENSQNHVFRQFECFLNSWIPKIIEKTLLHMLQYKKTYSQLLHHKKP